MVIVALSDIHGEVEFIPRIANDLKAADIVLISGDITSFGTWHSGNLVVSAIREYNQNILAVPGNCDGAEVQEFMDDDDINLHVCMREVNDIAFMGVGGALPFRSSAPQERDEDRFRKQWAKASKDYDRTKPSIIISHHPPKDTLADMERRDQHVGSIALREFIEDVQPLLCFSGHIHSARSIDNIGNTQVVNPGPLCEGCYTYAVVNREVDHLELRIAE